MTRRAVVDPRLAVDDELKLTFRDLRDDAPTKIRPVFGHIIII